eukprot:jgi/Mesvir1/7852/Mv11787-RA.1
MAASRVCLVALVALCFSAYAAAQCTQTNPQTYSATTNLIATNWQRTLTTTQFDRRCGDLQSVSVSFAGGVQGTAAYESQEANPFVITLNLAASITLSLTGVVGATNPLFSVRPTRSVVDNAEPYDNVLDFAGPSGGSFPDLRREETGQRTFLGGDMAPFQGPVGAAPGQVFWPAVAQAASTASASGNVIQQFLTNASATLCCAQLTNEEIIAEDMVIACCEQFIIRGGYQAPDSFANSPRYRFMVDTCCTIPCGSVPVIPATGQTAFPNTCYQEVYKECCAPATGSTNWPVTPPTVGNSVNPFCIPSIRSDPHFIAGNGLAYDFMGRAGETYCMFSDQTLHMNMHMIGVKSNPSRKATWMDAISIMYFPFYNITISAESPEGTPFTAAHGTITVNGKTMKSQKLSTMVRWHGLTVQRRKTRVFVSIENLIDVEIEVVRAAFWKGADGPGQNYLNFKVVSLNATENVHGVLGQTFRSSFSGTSEDVKGKNGEGVIEGSMADYVSSGLLAADCRVSQFLGNQASWTDSQVIATAPLRSWVGEAGGDSNYSHDELVDE